MLNGKKISFVTEIMLVYLKTMACKSCIAKTVSFLDTRLKLVC